MFYIYQHILFLHANMYEKDIFVTWNNLVYKQFVSWFGKRKVVVRYFNWIKMNLFHFQAPTCKLCSFPAIDIPSMDECSVECALSSESLNWYCSPIPAGYQIPTWQRFDRYIFHLLSFYHQKQTFETDVWMLSTTQYLFRNISIHY